MLRSIEDNSNFKLLFRESVYKSRTLFLPQVNPKNINNTDIPDTWKAYFASQIHALTYWWNAEVNRTQDPYIEMKMQPNGLKMDLVVDSISISEKLRKEHRELFPFFLLVVLRNAFRNNVKNIELTIDPEEVILSQILGNAKRDDSPNDSKEEKLTIETVLNDPDVSDLIKEKLKSNIKKQAMVLERFYRMHGFKKFEPLPTDRERPKGVHMRLEVATIRKDMITKFLRQLDSQMEKKQTV